MNTERHYKSKINAIVYSLVAIDCPRRNVSSLVLSGCLTTVCVQGLTTCNHWMLARVSTGRQGLVLTRQMGADWSAVL